MAPPDPYPSEPERPLEREVLLGTGPLTWCGSERRSRRYGSVTLDAGSSLGKVLDPVTMPETSCHLENIQGRLVAVVKKTRESSHVGDRNLGIEPSAPEVGERIVLGEGIFHVLLPQWSGAHHAFCLEPMDGRAHYWLDVHALYRAHEQTVELILEVFTDPIREG